ncbi:hypothetical protein D3C86_2093360 [compost metagenome]
MHPNTNTFSLRFVYQNLYTLISILNKRRFPFKMAPCLKRIRMVHIPKAGHLYLIQNKVEILF